MSEECAAIHDLFNALPRHRFPFDEPPIPQNGIYVLFQNGESGHGLERIVRIGTHTGTNQLRSRLKQHFLTENKDRSIFRKNIGRALLNKRKDPFLAYWELDLTTRKARERYAGVIDLGYQQQVEREVSQYIRDNFSFVAFDVEDKETRLELESQIISTVSQCKECEPSSTWLGHFSPKNKIAESGLWLVNELYKTPLDASGIERLAKLIER